MDVVTYAILLNKIKNQSGVTPEQIQEAVDNYLKENPVDVTPTATLEETKSYLEQGNEAVQ